MKTIVQVTALLMSGLAVNAQMATDFVAYLWGANEVPPNASKAQGVGTFSLDGSALNYQVALPDPIFAPTDAGIYGPADRSGNGAPIFDWPAFLFSVPSESGETAIYYTGTLQLTPEQISELESGLWYVNVFSKSFPNGEIRGQICPASPGADCDYDGVPNKDDLCPNTP